MPTSFVAVIVNTYGVPFTRPVIVIDEALVVETIPALDDAL